MGILFEPDTSETRKKFQDIARHSMIVKLLEDIQMDMQI